MGSCPDDLYGFDPALLMGQQVDVFLDVFKLGISATGSPTRTKMIKDALVQMSERLVWYMHAIICILLQDDGDKSHPDISSIEYCQ